MAIPGCSRPDKNIRHGNSHTFFAITTKGDILPRMSPAFDEKAVVTSLGQVALSVTNLPRAVAFYRDVVKLEFLFEAANMAFFNCAGVRLMLSISEKPESTYSSILYYKTADIHAASEQLLARGVAFESPARMIAKMPDHDLWMAFLRDTEGNLLALMSEVPRAGD